MASLHLQIQREWFWGLLLSLLLISCTKVSQEASKPVEWNGSCSEQYQQDYINLLNTSVDSPQLKNTCDSFYQQYADVKCLTEIDDVEVRVHTVDFDVKCQRGDFKDYTPPKSASPDDKPKANPTNPLNPQIIPQCSTELFDYFQRTLALFELNKNLITDTKDKTLIFNKALASYRQCNQYFHIYKYSSCTANDHKNYSYYDFQPYCLFFKTKLENLLKLNPQKYFPEEFLPLTNLRIRLKVNDPFIEIFKSKKMVKTVLLQGKSMPYSPGAKQDGYCYFISPQYSNSEKLLGKEIIFFEVFKESQTVWKFASTVENKSLSLYCRSSRQLFLQDLKEIMGNKAHIYTD